MVVLMSRLAKDTAKIIPRFRNVTNILEATPELLSGIEIIMVLLFGAWKIAEPIPIIAKKLITIYIGENIVSQLIK